MDGSMDWSIDGWIDQMNEKWEEKEFKEPRTKRERGGWGCWGGDWRKMRGNAAKEHYSQNSCSCVIYLVDGAQSKCKRKCWFVCLRFPVNLWGDWQISSVRNCIPHTCPGVKGVIHEVKSVSWGGELTKDEVPKRKLTKNMFLHSDLLTSLTSSLTPLFFTIRKLALRTNYITR